MADAAPGGVKERKVEKGRGKERKKKGKGKETEKALVFNEVQGAERCEGCVKAGQRCIVSKEAIEEWREDFRTGKWFGRAPPGCTCKRCLSMRKKCLLPASAEMRGETDESDGESDVLRVKDSWGGSVASSGKRSREMMEAVELPATKRTRLPPAMSEEQVQRAMLAAMQGIGRSVAELTESSREMAKAMRETAMNQAVQNQVLSALLQVLTREKTAEPSDRVEARSMRVARSLSEELEIGEEVPIEDLGSDESVRGSRAIEVEDSSEESE